MKNKKRVPITILCVILIMLFVLGTWRNAYYVFDKALRNIFNKDHYHNYEADDLISHAIHDVIDGEDIYYQGRKATSDNVMHYEYLIIHKESGQLEQIATVVNEALQSNSIKQKISIDCWITMPGGSICTANLTNYSDETHKNPDFDSLQSIYIWFGEGIYGDPSTYIYLPDIRFLRIELNMQRNAEAQGIDWYEIWPSLETVEVFYVENGLEQHYYIEKETQ